MASTLALMLLVISSTIGPQIAQALRCSSDELLYGENTIVDELLTCSLSRSFDLDLTPHGDRIKPTARTLVEQGLSNKTTIIHARLRGLWTAKRPSYIETGWKCSQARIMATSIVELSSLSLEVIEKLDMQLHRNQHKLAIHKPCKTFDLPVWMCRQSKPIYRTTTTWVNRAYFNLTLVQQANGTRPRITRLTPIFTCPETFKQKVTHSPSAIYIIARHMQQLTSQPQTPIYHHGSANEPAGDHATRSKRQITSHYHAHSQLKQEHVDETPGISHPSSFTTLQSGRTPAGPSYQNAVKAIMSQVSEALASSLNDCIHLIDSDLTLMADHESFERNKYFMNETEGAEDERQETMSSQTDESQPNVKNECSSHSWVRSRIELANQAISLEDPAQLAPYKEQSAGGHAKRNQLADLPIDQDQLLNPFDYYHRQNDILDQMIEDNQRRVQASGSMIEVKARGVTCHTSCSN